MYVIFFKINVFWFKVSSVVCSYVTQAQFMFYNKIKFLNFNLPFVPQILAADQHHQVGVSDLHSTYERAHHR